MLPSNQHQPCGPSLPITLANPTCSLSRARRQKEQVSEALGDYEAD